jgi:hypothetical protein
VILKNIYFCSPLGVAGICFGDDKAMLKGGKEGVRIKPVNTLVISATRRYQIVDVERRCLSFREARIVSLSQCGWEVIESSGSKGADLAAFLLRKEMMSLCAVLVAHGARGFD